MTYFLTQNSQHYSLTHSLTHSFIMHTLMQSNPRRASAGKDTKKQQSTPAGPVVIPGADYLKMVSHLSHPLTYMYIRIDIHEIECSFLF